MARTPILQIDLLVDTDSPLAYFYRERKSGKLVGSLYRPGIYVTAERKRRFVDRVVSAQKALCRTMMDGGDDEQE